MKRPGYIFLIISVLLPFGLALALGFTNYQSGRSQAQENISRLLGGSLEKIISGMDSLFLDWELEFSKFSPDPDTFNAIIESKSQVSHLFLLDNKGLLRYPHEKSAIRSEQEYAAQLSNFFTQGWNPPQGAEHSSSTSSGWDGYFWADGWRPFYYMKLENGYFCVEPNLGAFYEKVLGGIGLPDFIGNDISKHRVVLLDQRGKILKVWGRLREDAVKQTKLGFRSFIKAPLNGYMLEWYMDDSAWQVEASSNAIGVLLLQILLLGSSASIGFLGIFAMRKNLTEARDRISFVNQVSHELKTPLTNIRLYAELLESELEDYDIDRGTKQKVGIINRESSRLTRLIRNVLTFGKGSNNQNLHLRNDSLNEILERTIETFSMSCAERGITILKNLETPSTSFLDSDLIDQVAGNLISNVEKYAKSGKKVSISSWEDADFLYFSIEDWGDGISDADEKLLFQAFTRLKLKTSDAEGGTGLGLYISRLLIERHGGKLTYKRAAHNGSIFVASVKRNMK